MLEHFGLTLDKKFNQPDLWIYDSGYMKNTPTVAMELMLGIPTVAARYQTESAARLKMMGTWIDTGRVTRHHTIYISDLACQLAVLDICFQRAS